MGVNRVSRVPHKQFPSHIFSPQEAWHTAGFFETRALTTVFHTVGISGPQHSSFGKRGPKCPPNFGGGALKPRFSPGAFLPQTQTFLSGVVFPPPQKGGVFPPRGPSVLLLRNNLKMLGPLARSSLKPFSRQRGGLFFCGRPPIKHIV